MTGSRKHLGEILYKAGVVDKQAIIDSIKTAKSSGKRLGQVLLDRKLIDEETLTKALAKQSGLKYVSLDQIPIPTGYANLIPQDLIKRHNILPLKLENGRLQLVIGDPLDLDMMDAVRLRTNAELECFLASPSKIRAHLDQTVDQESQQQSDELKHSIDATAAELAESGHALQAEILRAGAAAATDDGPIVRLVNLIIDTAYHMRASDIHVEPMADRVRVRYRVDGVCLEKDNLPKTMQAQLMTRLKILSGMDIAEKRLPQDGRIKRRIADQDIDFRVSALPGNHGESVVLRILRPDAVNIGISALGFGQDNYEQFQKIIRRPNGIFLVTGPTGSGKTTTLYAALQELNRPDKKIITAEDPVEYNFTGMNQCQVKEDIGLTFAKILRAMLRQAPNIILVGEIRDREVGDVAIQAALTGHLVFSTLHTNDAPSAITRLIDMGIKPFLVASAIQAIMAQRLIRVICAECKTVDPNPDPRVLKMLGFTEQELAGKTVWKGAGCKRCNNTGFRGRVGIFEMLTMNSQIRDLAFNRAPASQLRAAARSAGMRTLLEDGKLKVLAGVTTPEDLLSTTQAEGVVTM